jgi:tetratricopeptide (TPR) repeat protein
VRPLLRLALREWPLGAAFLAAVSLLLLPRFARNEALRAEKEGQRIAELRREAESGPPERAEAALRGFIAERSESPYLGEAQFLLAQTVVRRARTGAFPGAPTLGQAWAALGKARAQGYDAPRIFALQEEIALMLRERGLAQEAVKRYDELVQTTQAPRLRLELARALALLASQEPSRRLKLLGEAGDQVALYVRAVPPEEKLEGYLTEAQIQWRLGEYAGMLTILGRELENYSRPEDRGRLQLERGKALTRLGRTSEALLALGEAEKLLADPRRRDQALVFLAELYLHSPRPEDCLGPCERLIKSNSAYAPVAHLMLGLYGLQAGGRGDDPLFQIRQGLSGIARPSLLEEAGFEFGTYYESLRTEWEKESDPARLLQYASLLDQIHRIFPGKAGYLEEQARIRIRAGDAGGAADRLLAASEVVPEARDRDRLVKEAAEVCSRAGLDGRAARLYRQYFDLAPKGNEEGLFRQGESLIRAGCYAGPGPSGADALGVLSEFLARARGGDPLVPRAILYRGRMLEELGKREDAVAEYDRILRATDLAVEPRSPVWAEALLGRGRSELELAFTLDPKGEEDRRRRLEDDGRRTLREYVERYGSLESFRGGIVEAEFRLARQAMHSRQWAQAFRSLEEVERRGEANSDLVLQARFLKGDALLSQGEWVGAAAAYQDAYRRYLDRDERVWGLIGRARALARMGQKDQARRDYENSVALYLDHRSALDGAFAGHGKEWWGAALETLRRELK